jgi:cell division septation protein DedD
MSIENVSGACDSILEVTSGATLVEGTSAEQRSASAVVNVATGGCPLSGCTRGHGYWKNHPERITPLLPVSLGAGGTNGMTVTDASAAVKILEMKTHGTPSNGITKLYAQLLTAKLNAAAGADTSRIAATIQSADAFLATHGYESWARLGASVRNEILGWMETLDAYNNGKMGPGVCTEPATPVKATAAAKKPVTQAQATKSVSPPKKTGNQQTSTKKESKKLPTVPLSWLAR